MFRIRRLGSVPIEVVVGIAIAALGGLGGWYQIRSFKHAGKGPPDACSVGEVAGPGAPCEGLPPGPFADTPELREWLANVRWTDSVPHLRRVKGGEGRRKEMWVSTIRDAHKVPLTQLRSGTLVAARISGDPEQDEDVEYGIGGENTKNKDLGKDFFVVLQAFEPPGRLSKVKAVRQVTIAKWRLYGMKKDKSQLIVVDSGSLKFCRHTHYASSMTRSARADFLRCQDVGSELKATHDLLHDPRLQEPTHKALREALVSASLGEILRAVKPGVAMPATVTAEVRARRLSLDTLLGKTRASQLYRDQDEASAFAPAWITCGIGCCSIDS